MSDWRELISAKNWEQLDNFWFDQTPEVCAEILEALRQVVPVVARINGIEREFDFGEPDEVPQDLAGAARILLLGELEAAASRGYPPTYMQQWARMSDEVGKACLELASLPEVTEGAAHMSRAHHAEVARDLICSIAGIIQAMLYPGDDDDEEPDELGYALQEHVATAATYAFAAGRHFQLALGKDKEPDAIRGMKVRDSGREGGHQGGRKSKAESARILAEMERRLRGNARLTVTKAAILAHKDGYGTSPEANRKLWQRSQQIVGT